MRERSGVRPPRDGAGTAWAAPDGRRFLVCATADGFALRSLEDWESDEAPEFEADLEGRVFHRGEPTGWRVHPEVIRRAIAS